ncbi:MAG TPA: ABC transporter ATP-binding protein [Pyrinomonadaceae bacterium]|nr:ABC transporter ATP-binding protein [Pyrinomonadaceae bacterium]
MPFLSVNNLSKTYGATRAADQVSLAVEAGEFFGLLGPSGCGKTTTLRLVAGLEEADAGTIEFDGRDITRVPAERRGFGMVFQNYALFPHMNVAENVAFGLRVRRLPKPEVAVKVSAALELVQLAGYGRRRIEELSGGQQQRVAIARAVAIEPKLLLFDEPLSNLDAALRGRTRAELRELVRRLNLTALYVTHDQEEAFAVCDRICVMGSGRVLQTGTPRELYERPATVEVARFLGQNNLISAARLTSNRERVARFKTIDGGHLLNVDVEGLSLPPIDQTCVLAARPEHLRLSKPGGAGGENALSAVVKEVSFAGATTGVTLDAAGLRLEALVLKREHFEPGEECSVELPREQLRLIGPA